MSDKQNIIEQLTVQITRDVDVVVASQKGRTLTSKLNFSESEQSAVSIAISEVARNIVKYAGHGEIALRIIEQNGKRGIIVIAHDEGPGIPDVDQAIKDGYSTGGGLGMGLPGARRLMDDFEIISPAGEGATVTMAKWEQSE